MPRQDEGELLAVAGLDESWPNPELAEEHPDKGLVTAAAIATSATDAPGHLYERSPLIIPNDLQAGSLDSAATDKNQVRELVSSVPSLTWCPESSARKSAECETTARSSST